MQQPAPERSGAALGRASPHRLSLSLCSEMMSSTLVMYSKDSSTPKNCQGKGVPVNNPKKKRKPQAKADYHTKSHKLSW